MLAVFQSCQQVLRLLLLESFQRQQFFSTQGVQLLVSKKGSILKSLARLEEVSVTDPEYYRIRKVPAIGYYIREKSLEAKQISFDDLG